MFRNCSHLSRSIASGYCLPGARHDARLRVEHNRGARSELLSACKACSLYGLSSFLSYSDTRLLLPCFALWFSRFPRGASAVPPFGDEVWWHIGGRSRGSAEVCLNRSQGRGNPIATVHFFSDSNYLASHSNRSPCPTRQAQSDRPIVVVSAMGKTTNALLRAANAALESSNVDISEIRTANHLDSYMYLICVYIYIYMCLCL